MAVSKLWEHRIPSRDLSTSYAVVCHALWDEKVGGFMTDREYAARIYCQVFPNELADTDMYARGILEMIHTLPEREQQALEYYYRDGLTYKQTGAKLGLSLSQARKVVMKAVLLLRHPARSDNMSIRRMVKKYTVL